MLRLYAAKRYANKAFQFVTIAHSNIHSTDTVSIPAALLEYSNVKQGDIYLPSKEELQEVPIIISTIMNSGILASAKFPSNHFDYIFIDEAGQVQQFSRSIQSEQPNNCLIHFYKKFGMW